MMDGCHGGRYRPDPNCMSSSSYKRITRAVTDGDRDAVARESVRIGYSAADDWRDACRCWRRGHNRPFLDSSTATGRVPANSENTMVRMAVIGTARKAPGMPHNSDHTARLSRMAMGLRLSELLIT